MKGIPCFKSCYSVATIEPDQVFILSERAKICLSDRFLYLVASLIDGNRTSDEIIEAIQIQLLPQNATPRDPTLFQKVLDVSIKAQAALFQLQQQGYLVENQEFSPSNLIS